MKLKKAQQIKLVTMNTTLKIKKRVLIIMNIVYLKNMKSKIINRKMILNYLKKFPLIPKKKIKKKK